MLQQASNIAMNIDRGSIQEYILRVRRANQNNNISVITVIMTRDSTVQ
jgi:hypothetical protein